MFKKVKNVKEKTELIEALKYIVDMTQKQGSVAVPKDVKERITKYEPTFMTVQGGPDPTGSYTVTATAEGIAALGGTPASPVADAATDAVKPAFKIESGIVLPESKRGGIAKADKYPFAGMEELQSFFIAATEASPDPAKSLASTITAANRRFAAVYPAKKGRNAHPLAGQPTGKDGRKFVVRPRNMKDHGEEGARVWRVKLTPDAPPAAA